MIVYEAISPHPPIIIPAIGKGRIEGTADATLAGMRQMARAAIDSDPETIIIISPHSNIFGDAVSFLSSPHLEGNLSSFGHREISSARDNDLTLAEAIRKKADEAGLMFVGIGREHEGRHQLQSRLDHGVLVPLYYLEEAGLKPEVKLLIMGYGYLDRIELYRFGALIREGVELTGRRCVLIASGDMSHRLKDEGPYDFHPEGPVFDREIGRIITEGDVDALFTMSEDLRQNAGECGFNSIVMLMGSLDGWSFRSELYSYEGPYGVGYLTAGFYPEEPGASRLQGMVERQNQAMEERRSQESPYVRWARMTLEEFVTNGKRPDLPDDYKFLNGESSAAFVSIKKNGQLRGCIGTFVPSYPNLAEEISGNALAAGLNDPRFSPVRKDELESLVYSVDLLSSPEPAEISGLDPKKYGVIVTSGSRRGLLLPDLEGVDTVEQQLAIALQKAGISKGQKFEIQRFEVKRFK